MWKAGMLLILNQMLTLVCVKSLAHGRLKETQTHLVLQLLRRYLRLLEQRLCHVRVDLHPARRLG